MTAEEVREYCLAKQQVSESFPFDEHTLVFKVAQKMFCLLSLNENPLSMNLKSDPEQAVHLRDQYPNSIHPGYHMNKTYWNTVVLDDSLDKKLVLDLIDASYSEVVNKLPFKVRKELGC